MKINPRLNMPYHIPSIASAKLDLRLKPRVKNGIRLLAAKKKTSMSKQVLEIFDYYFENAVGNDFWKDVSEFSSPIPQKPSKRTNTGGVSGFFEKLLSCS
jgi:hypothetical protein